MGKKKAQKMSLVDFLKDTDETSWADRDVDETVPFTEVIAQGTISTDDIRAEKDSRHSDRRMGGMRNEAHSGPSRFGPSDEPRESDLADTWRSGRPSGGPARAPVTAPVQTEERAGPILAPVVPSGGPGPAPGGLSVNVTPLERMSDRTPPTQPPYVAFIANLPFRATINDIGSFFEEVGGHLVEDIVLKTDRDTGRPKGYGYIIFKELEGLTNAVENMHGADFLGRPIKIDYVDDETAQKVANPQGAPVGRRPSRGEPTEADLVDVWARGARVPKKRDDSVFQAFGGRRKERGGRAQTSTASTEKKKPGRESIFGEGKAWDNTDIEKKLEEKLRLEEERIRKLAEEEEKRMQEAREKRRGRRQGESPATREEDGEEKKTFSRTGANWGGDSSFVFGRGRRQGRDRRRDDDKGDRKPERGPRRTEEAKPAESPSQAAASNIFDALGEETDE